MRKQDYLVELIRSLSPNESRYFKLYSSIQPGDKKYLELFEKLESRDNYNPRTLMKELAVSEIQLAATKHYLQLTLLRCLRTYDEQSTDSALVLTMKEDAVLLTRRRLYNHALEICNKAFEKARELEIFEIIDDLIAIKSICLLQLLRDEEAQNFSAEHDKTTKIISEIIEMNRLKSLAFKFDMQRGYEKEFDKLCAHPLLKKTPGQLSSLRAAASWFEIKFRYYMQSAEHHGKLLQLAQSERELYRKNPNAKKVVPVQYVVNFTRLANAEFEAGNFRGALKIIEELEDALQDKGIVISKAVAAGIANYCTFFRIYIYLNLHRFEQAVVQSETVLANAKDYSEPEQYTALFQLAIGLLHLRQHKQAVEKINALLEANTEYRRDLQEYVRPLLLMAQIDMGDYEAVSKLVKSSRLWMKRNKIKNPELDLFFKYALPLAKPYTADRKKTIADLSSLNKAGKLAALNSNLLFNKWLEEKAGGK
jgi:hypothetical protein